MFVSILCSTKERTARLYSAARQYESIEYVSVYPHRIVYGSRVRVLRDKQLSTYTEDDDKSVRVDIDSLGDVESISKLFSNIKQTNCCCMFVKFSDHFEFVDIFNVTENISKALLDTVRVINANN